MRIGRVIRRSLSIILLLAFLSGLGLILALFLLRPSEMPRTEIFKGVFLTVDKIPGGFPFGSKGMVVEVHLDEPGVRLRHRDFDYAFSPENLNAAQFNLKFADAALREEDAAVLVNTTIFFPDDFWSALPGTRVRSNETLIVEGRLSHVHEHSYLFYWDAAGKAHVETTKPPSEEAIAEAKLGIGVQGIPIQEGMRQLNTLPVEQVADDRTYIGVNTMENILYLFVFEDVTQEYMIQRILQEDVVYAAQLDSGTSSNLLIGSKAKSIRKHTGIRNLRPLAGYLLIEAEPLAD